MHIKMTDMKHRLLLPEYFHWIGWIILIGSVPLGLATLFWDFEFGFLTIEGVREGDIFTSSSENFTNELAGLGTLVGLLFICQASTESEDEFTQWLRLQSWHMAVLLYALALMVVLLLFYGTDYLLALIFISYLPFLIFYFWFRGSLYFIGKQQGGHEE